MNFIFVLIAIGIACYYANGQIKNIDNPLLMLYITWVTVLIFLNILVSIFIYLFSHSVKSTQGNEGIRGKTGIRGDEGPEEYCQFPVDLKKFVN